VAVTIKYPLKIFRQITAEGKHVSVLWNGYIKVDLYVAVPHNGNVDLSTRVIWQKRVSTKVRIV
jgi:hypothetical protein